MKQIIKVKILLVLIFSVAGCGFIANLGNKQTPTPVPTATPAAASTPNPFQKNEAEFTKLPAKTQLTNEPYIKGKTARYNKNIDLKEKAEKKDERWTYDDYLSFGNLSPPRSPEEVGTVILQRCEEIKLGEYGETLTGKQLDKIPAYGWKCEVTIIDRTLPALIHRKTFQNDLKDFKNVSDDAEEIREPPPYAAIDNFLKALPLK